MNAAKRLLAFAAAVVVAACGGGAPIEAGVGSGGSGAPVAPLSVGIGTVTGFGSVIVNGERYDETSAQVFVDERPDRLDPATVAAILLGTRVDLEHRDRVIVRATIGAELIGPVASVTASAFVALGQTVRVNADAAHPTAFAGFGSLADLAGGAMVEVHGVRAPAGEILATRVELRPQGTALRLAGTAADVTGNGDRFRIGAQPVEAAGATVLPAGANVTAGQRVVVWTDAAWTGGPLAARIVRVDTPAIEENAEVTLDGVIDQLRGATFRIDGVTVDAGAARFTGGTAADLANGRAVHVRGRYVGGALRATTVEIRPLTPVPLELTGAITDYVDADSPFRVREALVRVTGQTTFVSGSTANLGTGVQVSIAGALVDGVVQALTLELLPLAADEHRIVAGRIALPITIGSDGSGNFRLDGPALDVRATAATTYRNGTPGDLAVGRQVSVRGRLDGGLFVADEVRFLDELATPPLVDIDGIAGNVEPDSFEVNGQTVARTAVTTYTRDGAPTGGASLRDGVELQVVAFRTSTGLIAKSVEIRSPQSVTTSVRGLVSGRTPADAIEFLVGSQRVSVAAQPRVVPGNRTLADIVNGVDVEVQGTVVDGVLVATRIKLR